MAPLDLDYSCNVWT